MTSSSQQYQHIIAFEVAKDSLTLHILPDDTQERIPNTPAVVRRVLRRQAARNGKRALGTMLVVCEATGSYDRHVLAAAHEPAIPLHRAHGVDFIVTSRSSRYLHVAMTAPQTSGPFRVAALYRFCRLDRFAELRAPLTAFCCSRGVKGSLLLAPEGINGTVAGSETDIAELVAHLSSVPEFDGLEIKYSTAAEMPFHRMKVRLKREIVTMGVENIDPGASAGAYVAPADWNALIADPETILVDTRNDYEVRLVTFRGAVDPATKSFREFPEWAEAHRADLAGRKVAMFCTGWIRCEKATAYVKSLGIEEVFHLKGGILKYLEEVPAGESLWHGECFVFDERVSVTHGLGVGEAELCRACRQPLTGEDRRSPHYVAGVSCAHCHDARSDEDRARYAERHRQVGLAKARGGGSHIGG